MEQLKASKDRHCLYNLIKLHAMSALCLRDLPLNPRPIIAPLPIHQEHLNIAFNMHFKFSGNNKGEVKLGIMIISSICNGCLKRLVKEPNSSIFKE